MRRKLWWGVGVAVVIVLVAIGVAGYLWAKQVRADAYAGRTYLQVGVTELKAGRLDTAHANFAAASDSFAQVQSDLGPRWIEHVPVAGRQVRAVDQLATLGASGATLGEDATSILTTIGSQTAGGSVNTLIAKSSPHVLSALTALDQINEIRPQLSTAGLVSPVATVVVRAQRQLDQIDPTLTKISAYSPVLRYLLSGEHRLVVVSQNSAELRPTGGYAGSYAVLDIGPSGISMERYGDATQLGSSTLQLAPPTGARMSPHYLPFRDANWWIDFPSSAKTMLSLWNTIQPAVPTADGIVAIDVVTVQQLLAEFGPIHVAEFNTTFTAANLLPTLTTMIQKDTAGETKAQAASRKDVLTPPSRDLLSKLTHLQSDQILPTAVVLRNLVDQKRVQVYLGDATAQAGVTALGWSGAVAEPQDTTDVLGVVNAVVWASKMNIGVHKAIDYQVRLGAGGTATTKLTLTYRKDASQLLTNPRPWFGNYLRVYRPVGTKLTGSTSQRSMTAASAQHKAAIIAPSMRTDEKLPLATIAAGFDLNPGETRVQTYDSTVTHALGAGAGVAIAHMPSTAAVTNTPGLSHYRLLLIKQPDLEDIATTVHVSVPTGWKVVKASAWWRSTGTTVPVSVHGGVVTFTGPLTSDTVLNVVMSK